MIVVMRNDAQQEDVDGVIEKIQELGYGADVQPGEFTSVVAVIGDTTRGGDDILRILPGVDHVIRIMKPYKHVSRDFRKRDTIIDLPNGVKIGPGAPVAMMVGPCAVETEDQVRQIAAMDKKLGFTILRGGAFKPRTSPYAFQGLGLEGLRILRSAADEFGLMVVTEVMSEMDVEMCEEYADILQIGARTMHAFKLLQAVGKTRKPVLLKRGFHATIPGVAAERGVHHQRGQLERDHVRAGDSNV